MIDKYFRNLCALSLLVAFSICLSSCDENDSKEGELTLIGIEQKNFLLDKDASSLIVQTKEDGWGLAFVEEIEGNNKVIHKSNKNPVMAIYPDTISGKWFDVIKEERKKLVIKVSKNETGKERRIVVFLVGIPLKTENITISQK